MFVTISTLVLSVAVTSMKTFLVFKVIFERSELMIGGSEQTFLSASKTTGYKGESLMIGRYLDKFLSVS